MKRKLVKQGAATLMISLPSKWAKANNLDKGDEIDLEEKGNILTIHPTNYSKIREKKIKVNYVSESAIRTLITSLYRAGYDNLTLSFDNKNSLDIIEKVISDHLLGFEIIKKSQSECVVENITEPSSDQLENVFSKVFLNIEELFEKLESSMEGSKVEFEETEKRIIKFDNFCRRIVAKTKPADYPMRWAFQTSLNHGQRELYHLLVYLSKSKPKISKEAKDLLSLTRDSFNLLKAAYDAKSLELLEKLHEKEKDIIYKKGYEALRKNIDDVPVHHLLSAMRNFYLASSPLTTLLLEISKD